MKRASRAWLGSLVALVLSSVRVVEAATFYRSNVLEGPSPAQDPQAVVDQFYPQWLVDLAERAGDPWDRRTCFAVYDKHLSGTPRTIVAAYTNGGNGAIRVLEAAAAEFRVVAEPTVYDFRGYKCLVELLDLDGDGRDDVHIGFSAGVRGATIDWVFKWDGQQLFNLTPTRSVYKGQLDSTVVNADFIDLDNDGILEIYRTGTDRIREREPPPPSEVFKLVGDRFALDRPVVGVWEFERTTRTPDTQRMNIILPLGATGPYTLRIVNGDSGRRSRVRSGRVWVDGKEIVSPQDFGGDVETIERPVELKSTSELRVRLTGTPGSKMKVIIDSAGWSTR